jgi:hypothetical protein
MPVVQANVDPVSPQLSGKVSDPLFVGLVVPGAGDEGCRMAWHGVMAESAIPYVYPKNNRILSKNSRKISRVEGDGSNATAHHVMVCAKERYVW